MDLNLYIELHTETPRLARRRAHVAGAVLAAAGGEEALPRAWRRRAAKYLDIKQMVHVVAMQRTRCVPFVIDRTGAEPEAHGAAAEAA